MFGILDPLPPLVRIFARSIRVNPRNFPYYVCFWATPLPPPGADVLYVWPLLPNFSNTPHLVLGTEFQAIELRLCYSSLELKIIFNC